MIIYLNYHDHDKWNKKLHGSIKSLRKLVKSRPWIAEAITDGMARRAANIFRMTLQETKMPETLDEQIAYIRKCEKISHANNCACSFFFGRVNDQDGFWTKSIKIMFRENNVIV